MTKEALKLALEALEKQVSMAGGWQSPAEAKAITAIKKALAQPSVTVEQEPVGPEPFGFFQYDIRLDAWVQNRINNKGVAFYTKEKSCLTKLQAATSAESILKEKNS